MRRRISYLAIDRKFVFGNGCTRLYDESGGGQRVDVYGGTTVADTARRLSSRGHHRRHRRRHAPRRFSVQTRASPAPYPRGKNPLLPPHTHCCSYIREVVVGGGSSKFRLPRKNPRHPVAEKIPSSPPLLTNHP